MTLARTYRRPGTRSTRLAAGFVGALAFAFLLAAGPLHADARMFRGNSSLTGAYAERLTLPLALSWKYTSTYYGNNPSSPAVVDGTIYFASGRRLYAVDADTGALKWKYPHDQALTTTIGTSPAVDNKMVYFGADDGKLYALDADAGNLQWQFDTHNTISSSPTIVDGIIYFGSGDGRIWAVDSKSPTHSPVSTWKGGFKTSDEITGAPAVANGVVYVLSVDQVLHAISAPSAKERWNVRLPATVQGISPVINGDAVYVANGPNLMNFRARNGMRHWTTEFPSDIVVTPAVTDQAIYVVTNENRVYSLDPLRGRSRWKVSPKLDFDVIAPPTISGNLLFIGTAEGGLYAIDTDTGAVKWIYLLQPSTSRDDSIPKNTNIAAAPVVANSSLYVLSDDGSLCSFRADAADNLPPTITIIEPEMGVVINGSPPLHFEAKIVDDGSSVNPSSVRLMIDQQAIGKKPDIPKTSAVEAEGYEFNLDDSTLRYDTPQPSSAAAVQPLSDGRHTVTIAATDWMGNTATKTWSFSVDNSLAKRLSKRQRAQQTNRQRTGGLRGGGGGIGGIGGRGGGIGGRGGGGGIGGRGGGIGGRGGRGGGLGGGGGL